MIMLSLPFALIGGLWAVWLAGYNLSVAVAVGFIALGGVAAETAVVMVMYIDNHVREDRPANREKLALSISVGSALRLRPILMTVITVLAGLAPIFLTSGLGSDVMRRIALPMLGGMVFDDGAYVAGDPGGLFRLGREETTARRARRVTAR